MRILVVCCSGDVIGPMFSALLRKALMVRLVEGVEVVSVGVVKQCRGNVADMGWQLVERDTGISLEGFRVAHLDDVDVASFDEVICADASATTELHRRGVCFSYCPMMNPATRRGNDSFRTSFFEMRVRVDQHVDRSDKIHNLIPSRAS